MEQLRAEQIKELNEILSLSAEQQEPRLSRFLEGLSDGQIEYLRSMQQQGGAGGGQGCVFCAISSGGVPTNVIYQDEKVFACLDRNPANTGHFIVFSREHISSSFYMDDDIFCHLLISCNRLLRKMIEVVGASAGNILISNGVEAGQKIDHLVIACIPRFKDDKINFSWQAKPLENIQGILDAFREFTLFKKKAVERTDVKKAKIRYDEYRLP